MVKWNFIILLYFAKLFISQTNDGNITSSIPPNDLNSSSSTFNNVNDPPSNSLNQASSLPPSGDILQSNSIISSLPENDQMLVSSSNISSNIANSLPPQANSNNIPPEIISSTLQTISTLTPTASSNLPVSSIGIENNNQGNNTHHTQSAPPAAGQAINSIPPNNQITSSSSSLTLQAYTISSSIISSNLINSTNPPSTSSSENISSPPPIHNSQSEDQNNKGERIAKEINDFKQPEEEKINPGDYNIVGEANDYTRKYDEPHISEIDKEFAKFDPTDLLSVVLYKLSRKDFYFNITTAPCNIQIAFYVLNEDGLVDMKVKYEDSKEILKEAKKSNEYITNFQATKNGLIHIQLRNLSKAEITVTLALHHDEHKNELFSLNHLTNMISRVNEVNKKAKKLENLKKQYSMKYRYHIDQAQKHNKNILIYSIVEVIIMIGIFILQTRYIIKLTNRL